MLRTCNIRRNEGSGIEEATESYEDHLTKFKWFSIAKFLWEGPWPPSTYVERPNTLICA